MCSLAVLYCWLDLAIGKGGRLSSAVAPGWIGAQALLPDWMVPVAGLWVQEGPEARVHNWMGARAVLCHQGRNADCTPELCSATGLASG